MGKKRSRRSGTTSVDAPTTPSPPTTPAPFLLAMRATRTQEDGGSAMEQQEQEKEEEEEEIYLVKYRRGDKTFSLFVDRFLLLHSKLFLSDPAFVGRLPAPFVLYVGYFRSPSRSDSHTLHLLTPASLNVVQALHCHWPGAPAAGLKAAAGLNAAPPPPMKPPPPPPPGMPPGLDLPHTPQFGSPGSLTKVQEGHTHVPAAAGGPGGTGAGAA